MSSTLQEEASTTSSATMGAKSSKAEETPRNVSRPSDPRRIGACREAFASSEDGTSRRIESIQVPDIDESGVTDPRMPARPPPQGSRSLARVARPQNWEERVAFATQIGQQRPATQAGSSQAIDAKQAAQLKALGIKPPVPAEMAQALAYLPGPDDPLDLVQEVAFLTRIIRERLETAASRTLEIEHFMKKNKSRLNKHALKEDTIRLQTPAWQAAQAEDQQTLWEHLTKIDTTLAELRMRIKLLQARSP